MPENKNTPLQPPREPRSSHHGIYQSSILAGIAVAVYTYGFAFDDLGEEELVRLSALWVLPIVFGIYGFVAERILELVDKGDNQSIAQATLIWTAALPIIGAVLLLPFLFVKGSSSISIALRASLFWAVLMVGFFVLIFPLL